MLIGLFIVINWFLRSSSYFKGFWLSLYSIFLIVIYDHNLANQYFSIYSLWRPVPPQEWYTRRNNLIRNKSRTSMITQNSLGLMSSSFQLSNRKVVKILIFVIIVILSLNMPSNWIEPKTTFNSFYSGENLEQKNKSVNNLIVFEIRNSGNYFPNICQRNGCFSENFLPWSFYNNITWHV